MSKKVKITQTKGVTTQIKGKSPIIFHPSWHMVPKYAAICYWFTNQ